MIEIKFEKEKTRAVALDLEKEVGVCEYIEKENTWDIIHTIVNPKYRGQNIAKKLVECVLEEAKKNNKKIFATCSYANKLIEIKKNY